MALFAARLEKFDFLLEADAPMNADLGLRTQTRGVTPGFPLNTVMG